jgi:RNA polymerase sigma-70 factor (ECF subfamily)
VSLDEFATIFASDSFYFVKVECSSLRKSNAGAFPQMDDDAVFLKHQAELLGYLTRYTGDPELAADAAQDVYVRLKTSPPRNDSNLRAWLYMVATNVVRDRWKKREAGVLPLPDLSQCPAPDSMAPDPHAEVERLERIQLAHQILASASGRERTILLMWVEGFTHAEIAEVVGMAKGTIAPTIARSLKKLSTQITQFLREDVR